MKMPYKDPKKQREAVRRASKKYRERKKKKLLELKHVIDDLANLVHKGV